jgi:hypothetical protein
MDADVPFHFAVGIPGAMSLSHRTFRTQADASKTHYQLTSWNSAGNYHCVCDEDLCILRWLV